MLNNYFEQNAEQITAKHNIVNEEIEKNNGKIEDIIKIDYDDECFEIQLDEKNDSLKDLIQDIIEKIMIKVKR